MPELSALYHSKFYDNLGAGSLDAARRILPTVFEVVRPQSVVDLGCGVGTWLTAALELGAERAVGVEGDWVDENDLTHPSIELINHDLERPLPLGEASFDLAMSLEVAEHLRPERAASFIDELCGLAKHVFFGAAIPGQGGVNHLNEQWQSYWVGLFEERGYQPFDIIRPSFWQDREIPIHYRQNPFLFVHESEEEQVAQLLAHVGEGRPWPVDIVHPECHLNNYAEMTAPPTLRQALRISLGLPVALLRSVRARLPLGEPSGQHPDRRGD